MALRVIHNATMGGTNNESTVDPFTAVTVTVDNVSWTFGPNSKICFADDGVGLAVDAATADCRPADDRGGDSRARRT